MFFMLGTWPGRKELGVVDGYTVYMIYESLVIFFIPVFKFGKRYFAEKSSTVYEIDQETGKAIERGDTVSLNFTNSDVVSRNVSLFTAAGVPDAGVSGDRASETSVSSNTGSSGGKICMRCGFKTDVKEYTHCPMCGNLLVMEDT